MTLNLDDVFEAKRTIYWSERNSAWTTNRTKVKIETGDRLTIFFIDEQSEATVTLRRTWDGKTFTFPHHQLETFFRLWAAGTG